MDKKLLFLERYRKMDEKGRSERELAPPFSILEPKSELRPDEVQSLIPTHVGVGK